MNRRQPRPHLAALGLGLLAALAAPAILAQPVCADTGQALHGLWRLVLWPESGQETQPVSTGAMLLGPHPEYADSVRGRLRRSGQGADLEAEVVGDVNEGEFNLDESADGQTMDAVWTGTPIICGAEIRGVRRPAEGRRPSTGVLQFLLQRPSATR